MSKKSGLGRGLDSLISPQKTNQKTSSSKQDMDSAKESLKSNLKDSSRKESKESFLSSSSVIYMKIEDIVPNRSQPRTTFNEDSLQELADSIKQFGVIQPLIVQETENQLYQIIAGERRWRAARIAGLKEVPVLIKNSSPMEAIEIALIENIQREDLNPIEEAMAYQRLIQEYGLKQDEAAEKVSKSRTAVTNSLRLLKLDDRVKQMMIDGMISSGHGRALLSIEDPDLQYQTAQQVFDQKMSVRDTEKLVKKINSPQLGKIKNESDALEEEQKLALNSMQDKLNAIIGTKVSIKNKSKGKGKIEIEYYSMNDLERIMELFDSIPKESY